MKITGKSLRDLTAADVITEDGLTFREATPLREAARLLLERRVSGAAVVDDRGQCVGVLSTVDLLRYAVGRASCAGALRSAEPMTCMFQVKRTLPDGTETILCTLPAGVCPLQKREVSLEGTESLICSQPHCVLADWQVVELEKLPDKAVREFMTPDPVMVQPHTPIQAIARQMIDAHIHRVIVVDNQQRPIGIVATTDLLAVLAHGVA